MVPYYLLLDARKFREEIRPALAAAWRLRSFEPCRSLCASLAVQPGTRVSGLVSEPDSCLVMQVAQGLPFDRTFWRFLAGEVLLLAADDLPLLRIDSPILRYLLVPEHRSSSDVTRSEFAPIEQALHGTKDLVFGTAFYRPEHAGWNDPEDVARLERYLVSLDSTRLTAENLVEWPGLEDEGDREEEIVCVREGIAALHTLYAQAGERQQVIICETFSQARGASIER